MYKLELEVEEVINVSLEDNKVYQKCITERIILGHFETREEARDFVKKNYAKSLVLSNIRFFLTEVEKDGKSSMQEL